MTQAKSHGIGETGSPIKGVTITDWKDEENMGLFFKPGNRPFHQISQKNTYVDRTGVIAEVNRQLDRGDNLICLSLPRKSGKTWQLQTLNAYYDDSCDSRTLFEGMDISKTNSFKKHMNQYIVIRLDMAVMMAEMGKHEDIRFYVENRLKEEALRVFTEVSLSPEWDLNTVLSQLVEEKGRSLFFFIDEWDAPIRLKAHDPKAQIAYLNLLQSWFKKRILYRKLCWRRIYDRHLAHQKVKGGVYPL